MLHKSGRIDEDVAHRIKAAWLKPAMLYGSECWPITKALANRMELAVLRMLRWTCGKTMLDMIPNGVYRAELEVETIINKIRKGWLRWFGHVRRRPQSAPVRRVEALVVDSLRRRDRPKLRWEDKVKLDMKELLLSEDMTSDRNEWRARTSFDCECFSCLMSFLLFLFGFCVLDSDRINMFQLVSLLLCQLGGCTLVLDEDLSAESSSFTSLKGGIKDLIGSGERLATLHIGDELTRSEDEIEVSFSSISPTGAKLALKVSLG
nr:hypothetical protein [Tanacetum cinerariifolium]